MILNQKRIFFACNARNRGEKYKSLATVILLFLVVVKIWLPGDYYPISSESFKISFTFNVEYFDIELCQ